MTSTVAKAMLLILLLSIVTTSFAIITLASSLNDAEAVNVAGSMRMQSYRLAHDIQSDSGQYVLHIRQFEESIYSPSMKALQNWTVPDDITHDYYQLISRWHELKHILKGESKEEYLLMVASFVNQIDAFVFKLQEFSERKLIKLAWVGGLGLGGVLLISVFVVYFVRRQIVAPLRALVMASEQIKTRSFNVQLPEPGETELGVLTRAFNKMALDLGKLYRGLEKAVNEKTHKLQHANQSLKVLYDCSQELTASRITTDNFQAILRYLASVEGIEGVELEINEIAEKSIRICEGQTVVDGDKKRPLTLDGVHLGYLHWKSGLPCPDQALIDNFVQILSRAIYYNHAQRQSEQLLIMEERATIARELHDSLAQSLSYLKIQVSLLKRSINASKTQVCGKQTQAFITELDSGLSAAYTQLRELLTTFRLTIKEGSFGQALQEMLAQLGDQTPAHLELVNEMSSAELDAHQQVHLMQLIREATINAIKHAEAENIRISCLEKGSEIIISVADDGKGFETQSAQLNHYGMSIMQERAARLDGQLDIESELGKGCTVSLVLNKS